MSTAIMDTKLYDLFFLTSIFCKQIVYEFIAVCWKKNLKCFEDMGSGLYEIALIHIPLIET